MNDALQTAKATLLDSAGLQTHDLDTLIGRLMTYDIDYADLYFQYSRSESWSLEDGAVKSGSQSIDQGVGIRAISGEKTGFAYSDEFHLPALTKAADAARAIAHSSSETGQVMSWQHGGGVALYTPTSGCVARRSGKQLMVSVEPTRMPMLMTGSNNISISSMTL